MPFPEPVLDALHQLVPCDVVAYHDGPFGQPAAAFVGEPRGHVTSAMRAAEVRYLHQDRLTPVAGARKFSDFLTRGSFIASTFTARPRAHLESRT